MLPILESGNELTTCFLYEIPALLLITNGNSL